MGIPVFHFCLKRTLPGSGLHWQGVEGDWKGRQASCKERSFNLLLVIFFKEMHVDGLVQDCSNSIANTLELLQSCTKPSMY